MRLFSGRILVLLLFGACASSQEVAQRRHESRELQDLRTRLSPGMGFSAVQAVAPKMSSCVGPATGTQRCEASYLVSERRDWPAVINVGEPGLHGVSRYKNVSFYFQAGKLVRFSEDEIVK